jgi:hypothetical protein
MSLRFRWKFVVSEPIPEVLESDGSDVIPYWALERNERRKRAAPSMRKIPIRVRERVASLNLVPENFLRTFVK